MVVTAPKDPLFLTKSESTDKLRRMRQFRVLVFSDKKIERVTIDGDQKGTLFHVVLNLSSLRQTLRPNPSAEVLRYKFSHLMGLTLLRQLPNLRLFA